MATEGNGFTITKGLEYLFYAMAVIIMALSGFSSQQVLKQNDETKAAQQKAEEKQDIINEALKNKMDEVLRQSAETNSKYTILERVITTQGLQIAELQKQMFDLRLENGRANQK